MKKTLIGLCNNIDINFDKIKVWSKSFREFSDGDIILLCANANNKEILKCEELSIKTVPVIIDNTWYINHKRLLATKQLLETINHDLCLITDVFDVIFQADPFAMFDPNYDIFVSGEGVNVNQEPWNSDNISKIFPSYISECLNTEVINSGVIGGKRKNLIDLFTKLYELCEEGSNSHNIKDQAALIVMVSKQLIPNLKIFNLDDGWAMHCAVAGPTQFFEGWGFKDKLKYGIPKMVDDKVYTNQDKLFAIVHQFNRIPEWYKILTEKYV